MNPSFVAIGAAAGFPIGCLLARAVSWVGRRRHRVGRRWRPCWIDGPPVWPPPGAAATRARGLLLRLLTPEQRTMLATTGSFTERTATTEYTLQPAGLLMARRNGDSFHLCVVFKNLGLPNDDLTIAQLLLIRTDEAGLWRIANLSQATRIFNPPELHPIYPGPAQCCTHTVRSPQMQVEAGGGFYAGAQQVQRDAPLALPPTQRQIETWPE